MKPPLLTPANTASEMLRCFNKEIASLAERYDAWLLIDDAHGLGVVADGKGSSYVDGNRIPVPLQMGTLSNAIGGYGGYLCASKPVIDFIKTRARSFILSLIHISEPTRPY